MKPDKVLCCILLFAFLALTVPDHAQNTIVVYSVQQKRVGYLVNA